jgi:hypothetical protein
VASIEHSSFVQDATALVWTETLVAPAGPVGPVGPGGSAPVLKSAALSVAFLMSEDVTALSLI